MGWKFGVWMSFVRMKRLQMYMMLVYRLIPESHGWYSWPNCVQFTPMCFYYMLCSFYFFIFVPLLFSFFLRFCGYIFCKPTRDLTWLTKWFKALVPYAKCNHDSYESELDVWFRFYYLFCLRTSKKQVWGICCTCNWQHFSPCMIHASQCFHIQFRWEWIKFTPFVSYRVYSVFCFTFRRNVQVLIERKTFGAISRKNRGPTKSRRTTRSKTDGYAKGRHEVKKLKVKGYAWLVVHMCTAMHNY